MIPPFFLSLFKGILGLAFALPVLRFIVLPYLEKKINRVIQTGPCTVADEIRTFHDACFVADLHADSLLTGRDLRKRTLRGHVDLPRLKDGGVDLQVFAVVTKVTFPGNYSSNRPYPDIIPFLFFASWRSPATWFSPQKRALTQARELAELADTSPLIRVLRKDDLRVEGPKGLLALEGMHALENGEESLQELYSAGFRMMGLAHGFDNQIAGSAHGVDKYGLTELGRSLIPKMEALGITIDLVHASVEAFDETLALVNSPVVVSHGGVRGVDCCEPSRNLSDSQLRSIQENNGVVGIGYWKEAVCDHSLKGIVAAILHVIETAGIDHVGLGSDFDGGVAALFDTTGLPLLTKELLDTGLSQKEVAQVLGGNVMRVLSANLPE